MVERKILHKHLLKLQEQLNELIELINPSIRNPLEEISSKQTEKLIISFIKVTRKKLKDCIYKLKNSRGYDDWLD